MTTEPAQVQEVADRFLAALRTFDAEALAGLLAPDATRWLNVGESTRTAEEVVAITRVERTLIESWHLDVRHQAATDDGFVVQFVFTGTTPSGLAFRIPICIVAQVGAGRITHYDEYADGASLVPLQQELAASGAQLPTV
jgi:limonene-1,2-epoxide hydrolase